MKRNILIVVSVILALLLIGEIIYLVYRQKSNDGQQPVESTVPVQTGAQTGATQPATEGEEPVQPTETEPDETADPAGTTEPVETEPVETEPVETEPEESKQETQNDGLGENALPPVPI